MKVRQPTVGANVDANNGKTRLTNWRTFIGDFDNAVKNKMKLAVE